jgi:hypothetical protein
MTGTHVFEFFRQLSEEEQQGFIALLALWCDLRLPDGDFLIIKKAEYAKLCRNASLIDNEALRNCIDRGEI